MIVLDTHIWVWWVHGDERLTPTQLEFIQDNEDGVIGIAQFHFGKLQNLWKMESLNYPSLLKNGLHKPWIIQEFRSLN